jgi:HEAT repeat protein
VRLLTRSGGSRTLAQRLLTRSGGSRTLAQRLLTRSGGSRTLAQRLPRALVPFALIVLAASGADAQPSRRRPSPPTPAPLATTSSPTNLRAHVGADQAARLLRSLDPDERIRGIERASRLGTPEAIALLVESLEKSNQIKSDTRALLAMARGLARFADQDRPRVALQSIVGSGNPSLSAHLPTSSRAGTSGDALDEGDPLARAELARETAAIALARWGGDRGLEVVYSAARGGGSGQSAALVALGVHPPREPGFFGSSGTIMPASVVRMLGRLGDLRALDVLLGAAKSSDVAVRCAAIVALAELGDGRAGPLARAAVVEGDPRLREAAGEAFILLSAPERFKVTTALLGDEATVAIGLHMAERVFDAEITKLVAARAAEHPLREIRIGAIRALGRSPEEAAARALVAPSLLADRELTYLALEALARSPAPNAGALLDALLPTRLRTMAVRGYVVRALVRGERTSASDEAIRELAGSRDKNERALGAFARVALGDTDAESLLDDGDPAVRRAAAMGSFARPPSKALERALLEHVAKEKDAITRQVLAGGLRGGDSAGYVKTSLLVDRAEAGGGDAPLAAFALARRVDETTTRKVGQLLGSKDPVLRSHAARGLGLASLPDASGRLANAYAWETDVDVRRAIIEALATRTGDASAPARAETLALAAELDPDGPVRLLARRALLQDSARGSATEHGESARREVAWLRLTKEGGAAPDEAFAGTIVRSDGLAVPVAFDAEGYAVAAGLPPGDSRLILAPKLPTDNTPGKP